MAEEATASSACENSFDPPARTRDEATAGDETTAGNQDARNTDDNADSLVNEPGLNPQGLPNSLSAEDAQDSRLETSSRQESDMGKSSPSATTRISGEVQRETGADVEAEVLDGVSVQSVGGRMDDLSVKQGTALTGANVAAITSGDEVANLLASLPNISDEAGLPADSVLPDIVAGAIPSEKTSTGFGHGAGLVTETPPIISEVPSAASGDLRTTAIGDDVTAKLNVSVAATPDSDITGSNPNDGDAPQTAQARHASAEVKAVGHRRIWGARHNKWCEQTDSTREWYQHKRHVLVFTFSGKPVYTRYGSEEGLSSTTGALSAIVSKFANFFFNSHGQDVLRYFVAGEHVFVFKEEGPLWLVCISKCGDTYDDMVQMLSRVYLQIITQLTTSPLRTLQNRPNYDMRKLVDGIDAAVNSLIRWCTQDIYLHMQGLEPLPLPTNVRVVAIDALRDARDPNVFCAWLMAGHRLVATASSKQVQVNQLDLSSIINMIMSSASLQTTESWFPVCLPSFNDKAFAYAYISFAPESDVGIVFLSLSFEGEQFLAISQLAKKVMSTLERTGCLEDIKHAIGLCPVSFHVSDVSNGVAREDELVSSSGLGHAPSVPRPVVEKSKRPFPTSSVWKLLQGIIHAAYYNPSLQQYFSSAVAPAYRTRRRTKMLFRNYGRCRALLANAKQPANICTATDHEVFYVTQSSESHMYLAVPRGISTAVIGQFYQWVKSQESHLFFSQSPTW